MKKERILTQESFESLLAWLDVDRELAGKRYEEIRRKLIKIFTSRGCSVPEELADETIDRVISKVPELAATYVGDPVSYFCGVAHNVHLEYLRKKPTVPVPPVLATVEPEEDELEQEYECLERCMQQLTTDSRHLVLQYYREEKQAKISNRKLLADQLGIALNALRIKAFRIRASLHKCVLNCMAQRVAG
jgi:DNA-directed RNA polymerase specialized sigma24 family protein